MNLQVHIPQLALLSMVMDELIAHILLELVFQSVTKMNMAILVLPAYLLSEHLALEVLMISALSDLQPMIILML